MHAAAAEGHSSIVEVLIRSHADINAVTKVSEYIHIINSLSTFHLKLLRATYYRLSQLDNSSNSVINIITLAM